MTMTATSQVPDAADCVLRHMLEKQARRVPEQEFVRFWRDQTWTYAQTLERVIRRARTLRDAGVKQGDHVLCWMGNGPELLVSWFAINYLGAVYVPVNTAARGRPLEHVLNDADAPLLIAHQGLLPRLADIATGAVRQVLTVGDSTAPEPALSGVTVTVLADNESATTEALPLERPIQPWDTQAIMYTSGTTGPAKGVVSSYVQLYTMGPEAMADGVTADDCCLIAGPIFHCGSTLYVYAVLGCGGTMAMIPEFRTADFWDAVRDTDTSVVLLLGVMANFLLKAPATADDRNHPLRKVYIVPFGEDATVFRDRFGVDLYTVYNMTEIASPLVAGPGIGEAGLAGMPRDCFELRVVDDNDIERATGEVGELIIRSSRPWALCSGYYRNPEASFRAMRNGWFHTGDAFRRDAGGRFFFVDRIKDVIRRRGENISSFELEAEICRHPQVREAMALAVPSDSTEDEVLVAVAPVEGQRLDPAELVGFLADALPHYMVPRYIRVVTELPKTASGKLQKHVLRTEGVTGDTWDREQAGIRLKREKLQ